jgi:recombination protein RecT
MSQNQNSTALAPVEEVRQTLTAAMSQQFRAVMPTQKHVERFVRVVMTAVQNNPDLLQADRRTFYGACMKSAQDGLLPDGREAVLVIYSSTVQYQPMVEGLLKKFRNSGECKGTPNVQVVRESDEFDYALGDNPYIHHKPAKMNRGAVIGSYSIVRLTDGEVSREYMGIDEIMQVREKSKSKDSGPWKMAQGGSHTSDFAEMCRKTVFRRHYKRLPKSTDLDNVLKTDNEDYDLDPGLRDVTPAKTEVAPQPTPTPVASGRRPRKLKEQMNQQQPQPTPTAPAVAAATAKQQPSANVPSDII